MLLDFQVLPGYYGTFTKKMSTAEKDLMTSATIKLRYIRLLKQQAVPQSQRTQICMDLQQL